MEMKRMDKLEKQDLEHLRSFRAVLHQGDFDIKGAAVTRVAFLFGWFDTLYGKIENELAEKAKAGAPKIGPTNKKVTKAK